jgi:dihydroxy-acid dehydratase
MDAKTNFRARLPSRRVTEGPARAPHRPYARGIEFALLDVARVFKKTPYVADSKPAGRYVAKDMFEVGGIPLPMTTLRDHGFLHGDCVTVTGRTTAENLKSVKWAPNQDVAHPANEPITVTGGVVGPKGNLAAECAAKGKAGKVSYADA